MVKLLLRGVEGRGSTSSNGVRDGSAAGFASACALSALARCATEPQLVLVVQPASPLYEARAFSGSPFAACLSNKSGAFPCATCRSPR